MENQLARCKIVVIGDSQCGKTALLHVFAKDAYPEVGEPGQRGRVQAARDGETARELEGEQGERTQGLSKR